MLETIINFMLIAMFAFALGIAVCVAFVMVVTKRKRKRVKCPDCQKWVRDVGAKTYSCTDSKIKRGFVFNHKGRA